MMKTPNFDQCVIGGLVVCLCAVVFVFIYLIFYLPDGREQLFKECRADGHKQYECVGIINGRM